MAICWGGTRGQEQLCIKGSGDSHWQQVEYEPAVCLCSPKGQHCPGMHQTQHYLPGKGRGCLAVLHAVLPDFQHWVQVWVPQCKKEIKLLESIQKTVCEDGESYREQKYMRSGWDPLVSSIQRQVWGEASWWTTTPHKGSRRAVLISVFSGESNRTQRNGIEMQKRRFLGAAFRVLVCFVPSWLLLGTRTAALTVSCAPEGSGDPSALQEHYWHQMDHRKRELGQGKLIQENVTGEPFPGRGPSAPLPFLLQNRNDSRSQALAPNTAMFWWPWDTVRISSPWPDVTSHLNAFCSETYK